LKGEKKKKRKPYGAEGIQGESRPLCTEPCQPAACTHGENTDRDKSKKPLEKVKRLKPMQSRKDDIGNGEGDKKHTEIKPERDKLLSA
jgi:hypothetical protein